MKFYRILSDATWRVANDCSGTAEWSPKSECVMPPIACPVCGGSTRDTRNPGFCYPAMDVRRFPSRLRKKLDYGTVVGPEAWEELRQEVVAHLPHEVPITPGTLFGPGTMEVQGKFADVYPNLQLGDGRFMLSRSSLQRLREAGFDDLFAAPIQVISRRKAPDQYLELQIEHQARLHGSLDRNEIEAKLRKIKADWARQRVLVCDRCGREDGYLPKRIVLLGSSIPAGVSLFRLSQRPWAVFCTEAFAQTARCLAFTNLHFETVRTDGSESKMGLARVQVSRPELWHSPRAARPAQRQATTAPSTGKSAKHKKSPSPLRLDSLLQSSGLGGRAEVIRGATRPCLRLAFRPARRLPVGACRLGGLPDLPKEMAWPGERGAQLDFVVQLDCAEMTRALPGAGLPASGWLWFFYDAEHCPSGLVAGETDLWAVRYWDGPVEALSRASAPRWWVENAAFPTHKVTIRPTEWLPDINGPSVRKLKLKSSEIRDYGEALKKLRGPERNPIHKILGWPDTIQSEMEPGCKRMAGPGSWRLLLQLDSDASTKMMWGDSGRLYLWIRDQDLAARAFDRCWMMVQCY